VAREKESGQHTGGHGGEEGREEIPGTGFARERPEEEVGGGLLVFFIAVERESVGREWGLVGKTVPPHDLIPHRFSPSGSTGPGTGSTAPGT
jgi:hypothetical protein